MQISYDVRIIKMTTATPGANIYYTLDGTAPTPSTAVKYDGNYVPMGNMAYVRAIAFKDGYKDGYETKEYAINIPVDFSKYDFENDDYHDLASKINAYRKSKGLSTLKLDETLSSLAYVRAMELYTYGRHERGMQGQNLQTLFGEYGYYTPSYSEEYTDTYVNSIDVLYSNMLKTKTALSYMEDSSKFKRMGIASNKVGGKMCWVVIFSS